MKKLLLAGFFLLVPLVVLAVLVEKAFEFSLKLTRPLGRFVQIDTLGEMAVANIIAVLAILLVCLLAGLVAHMTRLSHRLDRLDRVVVAAVPAYAVAKVALGAAAKGAQGEGNMTPVLVRFDDYSQIAFEIERTGDYAMLFLPGSPTVFAGASVRVETGRVTPIELSFGEAVGILQLLGKGSLGVPRIAAPELSPARSGTTARAAP